jgi:predicted ABC-type ATPase
VAEQRPCIWVLAGTNGAGKSSIGGALLRESGGDYFNPDEVARALRTRAPKLTQTEANALAWQLGVKQLGRAIHEGLDYFMETTLGGSTITELLEQALEAGHDVRVWYVGLRDVELHLARVAARVQDGGHDIPEADIRRRFDRSRLNLIALLPQLAELKLYDNSLEASPARGRAPQPKLVLSWQEARIIAPKDLSKTPGWAKPIVLTGLNRAT